jgi:hypothetical protein
MRAVPKLLIYFDKNLQGWNPARPNKYSMRRTIPARISTRRGAVPEAAHDGRIFPP